MKSIDCDLKKEVPGITDSILSYQTEFQFLHFSIFGKLINFGHNIEKMSGNSER